MADYIDLELDLSSAADGRFSLWFRFRRPGDAAENSLGLTKPILFSLDEGVLNEVAGSPQVYGTRLAQLVFADQAARSAFAQARSVADDRSLPLRLRLFLDPEAPRLQNLRWETLVDLTRQVGLCTDEHVLFSRFLSSASWQPFVPPVREKLRALVLIASPRLPALEPILVDEQLALAQSGLADLDVTAYPGGGQGTLDQLVSGLHDGCDVLYLVAHGLSKDRSLVFLEKPDGSVDAVDVDQDLLPRLKSISQLPSLAVLVSCQSAGDAAQGNPLLALGPRLIEVGIPAVIAMHGKITVATMQKFLPVFFKELQRDGQIDRALAVARAAVLDQPDWWMPVLFSRLRDNKLLEPPALAQPLEIQYFEPETVYIPAGLFQMGRDGGPDVPAWEKPCHTVDLPDYRIAKYPITNQQYYEFVRKTSQNVNPEMGWDGRKPPDDQLKLPVIGVTWYQAMAYCAWLSQETGRKYALPNEAQWEKAARGTQGWLYPWGNAWQEGRSNPNAAQVTGVDAFPAQSPFGCYDMVGNIREWTLTLWGDSRVNPSFTYPWPEKEDGRNDPSANSLVRRVYRGGASANPAEMTCTARSGFPPDKTGFPGKRHGFRVVLISET